MIILSIKTDNPQAEIALFDTNNIIHEITWHAHRELADTIHIKIKQLIDESGKNINDIEAIVCFKGPGSFTGLRIGLTVANTIAYALQVPIVGETGKHWQQKGITRIMNNENEKIILPEYGGKVHITQPKK
jgi:tRNA threonylcarbamoyladenosine biosynthesis protein TsaB